MLLCQHYLDSTLTVDAATRVVLITTKDWYGEFADAMGIPWTIQEQIRGNIQSSVDDHKRAMMEYWVTTLHDASWITLAGVLYFLGEESALQEAKKFRKKRKGTLIMLRL